MSVGPWRTVETPTALRAVSQNRTSGHLLVRRGFRARNRVSPLTTLTFQGGRRVCRCAAAPYARLRPVTVTVGD